MTTWQLSAITWSWEPSVLVGCALLLGAYCVVVRFSSPRQILAFVAGLLVLGLALVSPLDTLGDTYLFSAHMLQHLLLVLAVPPLLLLGIPPQPVRVGLRWPPASRVECRLGHPVVAWLLGMGAIWIWHAPILYNATLDHEAIHILEHLCFLVSAMIFWWPTLAPVMERRLAPLAMIPYLFAAAAASSALGILLTFVPPGLYPAYLQPIDTLGMLPLLRDGWGLSPAVDQEIGGLLMWVPGGLAYLSGIIGALARWYSMPEEDRPALQSLP